MLSSGYCLAFLRCKVKQQPLLFPVSQAKASGTRQWLGQFSQLKYRECLLSIAKLHNIAAIVNLLIPKSSSNHDLRSIYINLSSRQLSNPVILLHQHNYSLNFKTMKKYLFLLLFVSIQTMGASLKISKTHQPAAGLEQFTGKYKRMQGTTVLMLNIYIENGKLVSKQLWDNAVKPIDEVKGDEFIVPQVKWPVKFIRDKTNKVTQMLVAGHDLWTRVDSKPLDTEAMPASPAEYLGKYQKTTGGQNLILEISLKNGKIWGTQLWDGGKSQLSYIAGDSFVVNSTDWSIEFTRNGDKKVAQLLLNGKEVFTRVNN